MLGVKEPDLKTGDPARDKYVFEGDVWLVDERGRPSVGKMDLYKEGHFVLEAKQGSDAGKKLGTARRRTPGWYQAMNDAFGQALKNAKTQDRPPPFIIVCDIGYCFDLYASFDGTPHYTAFPNGTRNRYFIDQLIEPDVRDLFRTIWLKPAELDPRLRAEAVTQVVAERLATLAQELEKDHEPELVSKFLMRCIFTMFAEDVGLLRGNPFKDFLDRLWIPDPPSFKPGVEELWGAMNAGKSFYVLGKLLRFNGGLFAEPAALPLDVKQLQLLRDAARCQWSGVEPAIFGTLLERALKPAERHLLGAYFTPRPYVERVVSPTIEQPLRSEWDVVKAEVRTLVPPGVDPAPAKLKAARQVVRQFHERLCQIRVLDPACGSGNFLYVALAMLKRLESEVIAKLFELGESQQELQADRLVSPKQFVGIEKKGWAREIAELVLWIGYLQWHKATYGDARKPPEPVLNDYKNIVQRDAILDSDGEELVLDRQGKLLTRWDGTMKLHPVTWQEVPDDSAREPRRKLINPKCAAWPKADFIVGNPPYIGVRRMKSLLQEEYVDALRAAYPDVPDTADLVMYWWHRAADAVSQGRATAFGFITTKSITQDYSRPVLEHHLGDKGQLALSFAIAEHPWQKTPNGAAVSVAMTVGIARKSFVSKATVGHVVRVVGEQVDVEYEQVDRINAALTGGSNARALSPLRANDGICFQGVVPANDGFKLDAAEVKRLGFSVEDLPPVIRKYIIGNDIVRTHREKYIIDFFGFSEEEAREKWPALFQHVRDRVWPERRLNPRPAYREKWWLFAEPRPAMRKALIGLKRFIVTPYTAKYRPFVFVSSDTLPDAMAYAIASDDPFVLGVLSSSVHMQWCRVAGGKLEDRPRYNSKRTFVPFPFPVCSDAQRRRIAEIGEEIDRHRRERQGDDPTLTLTDMYNVLARIHERKCLTEKERRIHDAAFVSILDRLHEELDEAVLTAYGWSARSSDQDIVQRVIAENGERAEAEGRGQIEFLRPEFQQSGRTRRPSQRPSNVAAASRTLQFQWPKEFPGQVAVVRDIVGPGDRSWTARDVARTCAGATSRAVVPALDTLVALGIAATFEVDTERRWKGLAKTGPRGQMSEARSA